MRPAARELGISRNALRDCRELRWQPGFARLSAQRDLGMELEAPGALCAEGSGSAGGHRHARYATALGSARETRACFDVGVAMGYIGVPDAGVLERLGQVIGTLTRVAK